MSQDTHLLLIRHARSTANADGILAGRMHGIDLDPSGREQSQSIVERLTGVPLHAVYGSPLARCRQTAEPLCRTIGLEYVEDERLNECDYGSWSGRTLKECAEDPLWATVQSQPAAVQFPDGESMSDMSSRVRAAIEDIASRHIGEVVALFSHGDPIKAMIAASLSLPLNAFQSIVVEPGSVTVIRRTPDRAFLVRHNDSGTPLADLLAHQPSIGGGDTSRSRL